MTSPCGALLGSVALLGLCWVTPLSAQEARAPVAGIVVDARSNRPVPGVSVSLGEPPRTESTDANGHFVFPDVAVGTHPIVVTRVGYSVEAFALTVGPTGADLRIAITEGLAAVSESVTVSAGAFARREVGVSGQQFLNSGELRQLGGLTLDDPLRAVQALSGATASDDLAGEFAVRGSGFRDLEYTLDDVPARHLIHTIARYQDGGSVGMVNSDVLDSATLLRGARPQRVEQRLGAAVAFATSRGSTSRTRVNVTASGTSASLTSDGPIAAGQGAWLLSIRRSYLDVFLRRVLKDSSLAFGFADVVSKVTWDGTDAHSFEALLIAGRSRFEAGPEASDAEDLRAATHHGWLSSVAWRHAASPAVTLRHRLFATGESYDNRNGLDERSAFGHERGVGYRFDAVVASTPAVLLEFGGAIERAAVAARHTDRVPGWPVAGGEDLKTGTTKVGGYGLARWARRRWTFSPGARIDWSGLLDTAVVSPWVQTEFALTPAFAIVGGMGVHHQWPEVEQVLGRRGASNLTPARALQLDVGLEASPSPSVRWRVTTYRRDEWDVVDLPGQYITRSGKALVEPSESSAFANRLRGLSYGVEGLLERKGHAFSGWAAYSLGRTTMRDEVAKTRFRGDFDQRHTVSLVARFTPSSRTSISARWRYGSNRPVVGFVTLDALGRYRVGEARNAARVPAYARLDVRVDRTFQWRARRLTLFGEIANALNHANVRQSPPFVDRRTGSVSDLFQSLFPLLPNVGFSLEW